MSVVFPEGGRNVAGDYGFLVQTVENFYQVVWKRVGHYKIQEHQQVSVIVTRILHELKITDEVLLLGFVNLVVDNLICELF
ncbi:hypothetical protein DGG96_17315 [Legionella qingyii]|uniref:Uncharacterized protein n=1 Tax=Legionella qingyii TaxID=2184757 RepID=A0A317TZ59_9GAMM|nr:hypothetical protein DGG96_17315 [Legionella qingyii]